MPVLDDLKNAGKSALDTGKEVLRRIGNVLKSGDWKAALDNTAASANRQAVERGAAPFKAAVDRGKTVQVDDKIRVKPFK